MEIFYALVIISMVVNCVWLVIIERKIAYLQKVSEYNRKVSEYIIDNLLVSVDDALNETRKIVDTALGNDVSECMEREKEIEKMREDIKDGMEEKK